MDNIQPQLRNIIARYEDELLTLGINVSAVYVFGSFSKGTQREDSDIDLIVVSPDFRGKDLRERLEVLGVAAARIMEPIESYGVTPEEIEKKTLPFFWSQMLEHESVRV